MQFVLTLHSKLYARITNIEVNEINLNVAGCSIISNDQQSTETMSNGAF